ncbi:hypothetical protein BpHYR1_017330 [Brachionus plicatilis]|uniref:Uncharacterized protein n=1 Tax=Brachionus plicatilis TaxID=10195 RepID=A0A3M7Q0Q3_BRAPC|nr:hypothetical protein BpHYR1_017330 [Brachionus plicatilis]
MANCRTFLRPSSPFGPPRKIEYRVRSRAKCRDNIFPSQMFFPAIHKSKTEICQTRTKCPARPHHGAVPFDRLSTPETWLALFAWPGRDHAH